MRRERFRHRPDLVEREALGDVLRTVPVEPFDLDQEAAFDARAVLRRFAKEENEP